MLKLFYVVLDEMPFSLEDTVARMKSKEYDYLDHKDVQFDEDFAEVMKVADEIQVKFTAKFILFLHLWNIKR